MKYSNGKGLRSVKSQKCFLQFLQYLLQKTHFKTQAMSQNQIWNQRKEKAFNTFRIFFNLLTVFLFQTPTIQQITMIILQASLQLSLQLQPF